MNVDTDEEVLQTLADGKSMDYEQWRGLLTRLLTRLEKIVQEEFPPLKIPASSSQNIPSSPPSSTQGESTQSTQADSAPTSKAEPSSSATSTLPATLQALLSSITTTLTTLFKTHPPHTIQRLAELLLHPTQHHRTLPSYLHALDRVVHVTSGAQIFPLPPAIPDPSSLSILSNGTAVDPLSISWGNPASTPTTNVASNSALGSDESLGGALLTPITWLTKPSGGIGNGSHSGGGSPLEGEMKSESTETIDGPNGPGGVETVTISVNRVASTTTTSNTDDLAALRAEGGITQGELLRQEQKAGVVPATQLRNHGTPGDENGLGEEDEAPHARGPEEIGSIDMGPQSGSRTRVLHMGMTGIDVEAAVGRRLTPRDEDEDESEEDSEQEETSQPGSPKRGADGELSREAKRQRNISVDPEKLSLEEKELEPEVQMVDADGKTEEEAKIGEKGENKGPDAVDSSAV